MCYRHLEQYFPLSEVSAIRTVFVARSASRKCGRNIIASCRPSLSREGDRAVIAGFVERFFFGFQSMRFSVIWIANKPL